MCSTLRAVADLGLTVVAVIHQPRREIMESLDDLLLLAPGGVTAYMGPRSGAIPYFARLGCAFAAGNNPADELLDFVAGRGAAVAAAAAAAADSGGAGGPAGVLRPTALVPSPSGSKLTPVPDGGSAVVAAAGGEFDDAAAVDAGGAALPARGFPASTASSATAGDAAAAAAAADASSLQRDLPATSAFFEAQWRAYEAASAAARKAAPAQHVGLYGGAGGGPRNGSDATEDLDDDDDLYADEDEAELARQRQRDAAGGGFGGDDDDDDASSDGGYELALEDAEGDGAMLSADGGAVGLLGAEGGSSSGRSNSGRRRKPGSSSSSGIGSLLLGHLRLPGSLTPRGIRRVARRTWHRLLAWAGLEPAAAGAGDKPRGADGAAAPTDFGRGAPFLRQVLLCHSRSLLQQFRSAGTFALEMGVAATAGGIMGGAAAQLPEMYNGILKVRRGERSTHSSISAVRT